MNGKRLQSAALFLTLLGAMLFTPPLVLLFNLPVRVFGLPSELLYIFLAWIALCAGTALLAGRLTDASTDKDKDTADP